MNYYDFETALSKPRIGRFLLAAKGEKAKALHLYKLNIQLSQTLFGLLSIFEVTLRNHIDQYYKTYFNDYEWLKNNCEANGMFNHPSFEKSSFESKAKILTTIIQLGNRYNHDRLVAELSFGFWTYMFAPIQFMAGGQGLHKIFIERPKGTTQKNIFNELDQIRSLRNRIAHHEPLCFDKQHNIYVSHTNTTYRHLIKHTNWLGYNPNKLFLDLDETLKILTNIENEK
jgi:hypothetical protein